MNPKQIRSDYMLPVTPFLTVDEAAAFVKRGPNVIRRWITEGHITAYQPEGAGSHLVDHQSLIQFIKRFSNQDLLEMAKKPNSRRPEITGEDFLAIARSIKI